MYLKSLLLGLNFFLVFCLYQALPQYQVAHERAVFKAAAVVTDTKKILKFMDSQGLAELRAMQKPDSEIEDLLAAIIIIGEKRVNTEYYIVSCFSVRTF